MPRSSMETPNLSLREAIAIYVVAGVLTLMITQWMIWAIWSLLPVLCWTGYTNTGHR